MQIRQLEYFVSLCETLNFTRTANAFYVSQTAVTQQIKSLEGELGTALFLRTKRKVELTAAGRLLLEDARSILSHVSAAKRRIQALSGEISGKLSIGFLRTYENEGFARALRAFRQLHPEVSISLHPGSVPVLNRSLRQDNVDMIFTNRYRSAEEFCSSDIKQYPLMAVMPHGHPLSSHLYIHPNELKDVPIVDMHRSSDDPAQTASVMHFFSSAGFMPQLSYLSDDVDSSLLAVASGLGIALFPSYVTDHFADPTLLDARPIIGYEKEITVAAFWKPENTNPLIPAFLEIALLYLNR